MSQFGKKAINFWDWNLYLKNFNKDNDTFKRWNQTPKETQLELLKKWYPIGMKGRCILVGFNRPSDTKYEITGYIEQMWGYLLHIEYLDSNYGKECHPVKFIPEPEDKNRILRDIKLNRLLS